MSELQQQIEALTTRLETYEAEMIEWRKVNLSRRGPEGPRGERGVPGVNGKESTTPGPEGRPGKDANIDECVSAAQSAFASEISKLRANLGRVVVQALKDAGVVDTNGQAILVPGPAGREGRSGIDGRDSNIPGPQGIPGADGQSVQLAIGKVSAGDHASASIRVVNGISYLDVVLPRGEKGDTGPAGKDSTVAGRDGVDGKNGTPGPRGPSGDIQAAVHNAVQAVEKRFAELRAELIVEVPAPEAKK